MQKLVTFNLNLVNLFVFVYVNAEMICIRHFYHTQLFGI